MNTLVKYPPQNPGEYSEVEYRIWGIIPIRTVVSKRVEGWCVYMLLKYMSYDYYVVYGDKVDSPTTFERVRLNGDKMPEEHARKIFSSMNGLYVV